MSLGWEASSLRASIRAVVLQKMSCLYEGGGAEGDGLVLEVCVCFFWGGGPALGEDCGNKPKNKKDAHAALKCKEEDKVGEQQMPRTTRKPPHLE